MTPEFRLAQSEHVPERSAGDWPLVILVHGSLDRAGSFARVVRRLDDLHTLTYDRRGYHRSRVDGVGGVVHDTLDGHIDDLLSIIDGRPCAVIGHSYGGDIALGAALRPGDGASIRSVGAYEPPMPWLGTWASRPRPRSDEERGGADADDPDLVAERFFRRMVGDTAWERLPEATKTARRAEGPALAGEIGAIRTTVPPFDVARLAVPAVFGRGSDSLPHHRMSAAWLAEHTPDAELIEIAGAGHGAHLTHPDAFAKFVRTAAARAARDGGSGTPH